MESTVEKDISRLHVVGTSSLAARLGLRGAGSAQGALPRLALAAPRTYRVRGEIVSLPQVIGVVRRPLRTLSTVAEQAPTAA